MEGYKLRKIIIFAILIFGLLGVIYGDENFFIQGIVFDGVKNVPYDVLQNSINIKVLNTYSKDYIEKEVQKLLKTGYFKYLSYELIKRDVGYELVIHVEELPLISKIVFPDTKLVSVEEIKGILYSKERGFFNEEKTKEDCSKIEEYYSKKGFVLAKKPEYFFKDNVLTFTWEELPPIGRIEVKAKSYWEEPLIKRYLKINVGDYLNMNKIEELNDLFNKKNIKIKVQPEWKIEKESTILYLNVVYLPPREISLSYNYNESTDLSLGYFWGNVGYIKGFVSSNLQGSIDYGISLQSYYLDLNINNKDYSVALKRQMSKTNNIEAELGYRGSFVINDKALFIYFTQDLLKTDNNVPESGRYIRIGLDFHGGGSLFNFSILSFEGKYHLTLGQGLDRKIIGFEGGLEYPWGNSPESGNLGIKFLYTIPLGNNAYVSLKIGGGSNFDNLSSLSDLKFNILGGIDLVSSQRFVDYSINLESDFVNILKFKAETKIKF